MRRSLLSIFLLTATLVEQRLHSDSSYEPLYAGTLLAYYSANIDPGQLSVQPYIYATRQYGAYDKHWTPHAYADVNQSQLFLALETGITSWLDVALDLTENYIQAGSHQAWRFGDTAVQFGLQILRDQKGSWTPDCRIVLGESFPTGAYQDLDPHMVGADSSGTGAYTTSAIFIVRKIFYLFPKHPFNWNLNLYYVHPTETNVKGLNIYGGGEGTKGTVKPGDQFIANLAFEYSFNRCWAMGMDLHYERILPSHFSGNSETSIGLPLSERYSIAPCIEYNFSEIFSFTWGAWVSVAGKNSGAFTSLVANVFYAF